MNKITLPKGYHNFADKRRLVGLPNAFNVLSNLFIIIPVIYLLKHKTENNTNNNLLIIHITLLSLASAYYHYNPTDKSIFWDILLSEVSFNSFESTDKFNGCIGEIGDIGPSKSESE